MPTHIRDIIEGRFALFLHRVSGAIVFDGAVYEDVEADPHATTQAIAVVLLSAIASGIGAGGLIGPRPATLAAITALALITWLAWATLMFQIGTRLLPEPQTEANLGELLRTLGFAASPGMLQIFAILPGMAIPVFTGTWVWMIGAMIVGVRHALDYDSTARALAVCVVAASLAIAMAFAFGAIFAPIVN
jgi:hypothetical protein